MRSQQRHCLFGALECRAAWQWTGMLWGPQLKRAPLGRPPQAGFRGGRFCVQYDSRARAKVAGSELLEDRRECQRLV